MHICGPLGPNLWSILQSLNFMKLNIGNARIHFQPMLRTITIVISTNFTYLDDLETTMALEVTCLHILFVGFPNRGV